MNLVTRDYQGEAIHLERMGHVYILESNCGTKVKIGRSRHPARRVATLKTQANTNGNHWVSPLQLDSWALEKQCHDRFAVLRENGEWFEVPFNVAVAEVQSRLIGLPPDHVLNVAKEESAAKQEILTTSLINSIHRMYGREEAKVEIAEDHFKAIEFVISREVVETWDEDKFLDEFDQLSHGAAVLVDSYTHANCALLLAGLDKEDRMSILIQYAMDWRMANTPQLAA